MAKRAIDMSENGGSDSENEEGSISNEDQSDAARELQSQLNLPSTAEDIIAVANAKSLAEAMRILAPDLESLPKKKRGKYGKRKHLSEEERQELTRRRNRENARSTRLRKKVYVEHLRKVVDTLKDEQLQIESELAHANSALPQVSPLQHQQEHIQQAVLRFFQLRSCGHLQPEVWREIVTPDVILKLPLTTYRSFDPSGVTSRGKMRECVGLDALIADTASLSNLCKHLCVRRARDSYWCEYAVLNDRVLAQNDRAMCTWHFTLSPATNHPEELPESPFLQSQGMASFKFRDVKICEVELKFDVVNIVHQINAAPDTSAYQHPLQATSSNTGLPLIDFEFLRENFA